MRVCLLNVPITAKATWRRSHGLKSDPTDLNITVNSEIFARVLFSRNFAYAKFRENKILTNWKNHSIVFLYRQITPVLRISTSKICVFTLLAKIKF